MRVRATIFRLAALFVLLSSASDYSTYDLYDPAASMSSPGPTLILTPTVHTVSLTASSAKSLPDDYCLCCAPSIALRSISLEGPVLISSIPEGEGVQALISDRFVIDRPPRS